MEKFVTLLIACSVVSVRGQLTTCRASIGCNGAPGDDLGVVADPRDCCLGNPDGLAYVPREGACIPCVVVGFFNTSFSGVEQGRGHSIAVGYQKGAAIARQNLVFNVVNIPGTAKMGPQFDYTVNTQRVRALWAAATPDNVVITFRVDAIAQEPNETFSLILNPLVQATQREGLFFLNTIEVTIVDNDSKDNSCMVIQDNCMSLLTDVQFSFTESSYSAIEHRAEETAGTLPVLVFKSTRIATQVELMVVPLTVQEARATSLPLPPNIPEDNSRSPPFANRNDFNNTNITLVFEPDEDAEVIEKSAPIFVIDDDINEANEQVFVVELILVDSLDPATIGFTTRPSSLCKIIDRDPIRIGFELYGYTYEEPQFDEFIGAGYERPPGQPDPSGPIYLVKENNITSEQTFLISIEVTDSAPSNSPIQPATIDRDYNFGAVGQTSATYLFNAFQQRIPFQFTLLHDTLPEGDEAFQAILYPEDNREIRAPNGTVIGVERFPTFLNPINTAFEVFITILDDDPIIIGFTNTSYTVDEGIGILQVDVQVFNLPDNQPLPVAVDLVIQSVSGSAIGGSDYQEINAAALDVFLSFDNTNHQQSFNVTIIDDSEFELDVEDFTLELRVDPFASQSSNLILCPNISTVEILDDDLVVIGFLNTSYTVGESDGQVNIQLGVISPGRLRRPVTVQFSTSADSADAGSDYSESVIEFTFDSATREPVPIIGDSLFELTELFSASLTFPGAPPPRVYLAPASAQISILDDDVLTFGFEPVVYDVLESVGSINIGISFISGNPGEFVPHVNASTVDGTAIGRADYISVVEQSFPFTAVNRLQNFTVQMVSDDFTELNESFSAVLTSVFLARTAGGSAVDLSDQERARLILNPDTATVTIKDDDEAVIGFVNTDLSISEDGGELEFEIAVLQGNLRISVPVSFATADGSASAGLDYETTTRSLIFTVHLRQSVLVHIINDSLFENSENFFGLLSAVGVLPSNVHLAHIQATATIIDDSIVIGFDPASYYNVNEPDGIVTLRVRVLRRIISQGRDILVRVATADGSAQDPADYGAISQVLTFSSSVTIQQVNVSIVNDNLLEIDEVITASLALVNATDAARVGLQPNSTDVTILDEDMAVIGFILDHIYSVVEGTDQFANLTVQLISGQLGREMIVTFDTQSGSATSGLDYVAVLNQQLTFGPSVSSNAVYVQILDDSSFEKNIENFTAILSTNNGIVPRLQLGDQLATVNISDNEVIRIGFESVQYTVSEASTIANIRIEVSGGSLEREIIINFSTSDSTAIGGEDYVGLTSFPLTFDSSNTVDVVPLVILDDEADENTETMSASLSFPGLPMERVFLEPNTTVIQIHDDDVATIGFVPDIYSVVEGTDRFSNLTVQLISGQLGREVIVTFDTQSGSATSGLDYIAVLNQQLTFGASVSSNAVYVQILDDENFEEDIENFTATLSTNTLTIQLGVQLATVKIADDEIIRIGFESAQYTVSEASTVANIRIEVLGGSTEREIIVNFSTSDSTAIAGEDYAGLTSFLLTFDSSNAVDVVPLVILDDEVDENTETMSGSISFPGLPLERVFLEPNTTVVQIQDDDNADIGFISPHFTVRESDGQVNIQVGVLSGSLQKEVTLYFFVTELNALVGEDYHNPQVLELQLNFTTNVQINIPIINDEVFELSESFLVNLLLVGGSTSQNSTEVIILDDDELVFGFSPSKYEIHESEGPIIVNVFFINGNPGNYQPLVLISTHNGTATEGTDFDAISFSWISFTVSNQVKTLAMPIISSNSTERSEEFFVTLDGVILIYTNNRTRVNLTDQERARLMLNPRRANVTILDENVAIIGFLNTNLSIFEGKGALNFTIGVIQGYLDTFVTVSFTTEEATAKAGVDYSINTSKFIDFTGDSVHSVSVQIIDDDISEPPETFFGLLSIADGTTIPPNIRLEPTRATATIVNDNALTKSEESNSTITSLAVVLVCTLAFLTLITCATASIVACFVYKKKSKRKIVNMQEHVYESVSLPPTTLVTFSEPAKLECDLYDEVNTASGSTTAEFELTDNEAYSSSMPPTAAERAPNTDQTESADL